MANETEEDETKNTISNIQIIEVQIETLKQLPSVKMFLEYWQKKEVLEMKLSLQKQKQESLKTNVNKG